jgi:hypothetical protein
MTSNITTAPIDCKVSDWVKAACVGSNRKYTRTVTQQPKNGGKACPVLEKSEADSTCVSMDCKVSDWIKGDCVGSKRNYTRTITQKASGTGLACPADLTKIEDDATCAATNPPVDCKMSDWVKKTCADGIQNYERTIQTPAKNGGKACDALTKTEKVTSCPDPVASNTNNGPVDNPAQTPNAINNSANAQVNKQQPSNNTMSGTMALILSSLMSSAMSCAASINCIISILILVFISKLFF